MPIFKSIILNEIKVKFEWWLKLVLGGQVYNPILFEFNLMYFNWIQIQIACNVIQYFHWNET
jgi:hypothetical protein